MKKKIKILKEIKKLAVKIDHDLAFGGKSKGNKHLSRVVRIAKHIARKVDADLFITIAGAFLHDTALPSGNDYNYKNNKIIILKLLKEIDLTKEEALRIAECVASHEGTTKPKTVEAQIVHDADVIEKLGLLGIIRHTWKLTNLNKINPEKITKKDITNIVNHINWRKEKLQTPLGIKIGNYVDTSIKTERLIKLISIISKMAHKGIITEKIAKSISKHLNQKENIKLTEQLNLKYLKKF